MAIPDYQTIMLPLLKCVADGKVYSTHEVSDQLAKFFSLTEEEERELLPSGSQTTFFNRVSWARTYLKHAGILTYPKRGFLQITRRGEEVLKQNIDHIDNHYLSQYPEFLEFRKRNKTTTITEKNENQKPEEDNLDPLETLENAYQKIRSDLAEEILDIVLRSTPRFFERLVVELLVKMGYGGSQKETARAVGKSGDEGIDGIIDEDRLGFDTIYIQAKRWQSDQTIGRPEIQKFVGALQGKRARKGVFITTSRFSSEAIHFVGLISTKVVLIDGDRLADLMIDYGVGVSARAKYEIKEVDSDFFDDIEVEKE